MLRKKRNSWKIAYTLKTSYKSNPENRYMYNRAKMEDRVGLTSLLESIICKYF